MAGIIETRGAKLYWKPERPPFDSREHAGRLLGQQLISQFGIKLLQDAVVLGCPRGGMIFARAVVEEIKKAGGNPELDLIISRKIPLPDKEDYAVGAITEQGDPFFVDRLVQLYQIDPHSDAMQTTIAKVQGEVRRRVEAYREGRPIVSMAGKVVIIVDGLVTGATITACIKSAQAYCREIQRMIIATPVSSEKGRATVAELSGIPTEDICTAVRATPPQNVGWNSDDFYNLMEFDQMTDEQVRDIVKCYK